MTDEPVFEEINEAKANMDDIYDHPDPRAYFRELKKVGYTIPNDAKPIFQKLISQRRRRQGDMVNVLDLGCSYGVNAALLKHDLSIEDLYEHWGQEKLADATLEEVVERDRRFFADLDESQDIEVIGLDIAENAVVFAEEAGLLDEGITVNLETEPLPVLAEEDLAQIDLVTSTGCVGYVTEKSFDRLLPAITPGRKPWIANFVLRMFPFGAIEESLSDWGYVTEKLDGQTFVQREFASSEERNRCWIKCGRSASIRAGGKRKAVYWLNSIYRVPQKMQMKCQSSVYLQPEQMFQ